MSTSAAEVVGGRYEIVRTLGQGAFGHTFLARDRENDRTVAIKLLDTRGRVDPKAYELFRREAEVLRAVRHHGIPEVYDTLQDVWYGAPATFLVMEYIEGTSLAQIIDEKRSLEGSDVVHLFLELLGILDYLHSRVPPILHRDIKPSNIILRPNGFPALVDFGSVRRVFMSLEETGSTIAGTYGYMPYEQYMGQASPASDLYATAATLLHLLTGRAPREFMNDEGRIQVPEMLPSEPRLRSVIARLLRPSPTERFASARDVRNALVGGAGVPGIVGSSEGPGVVAPPPGSKSALQRASPTIDAVNALPPAPRELKGDTKSLMKRASPSTLRLLYASEKGYDDFGLIDVLTLTFFSVITAGILPVVYANMASTRRRRMRRFFRDGEAAIAEVTRIDSEKLPFDEKISRVGYQFHADGHIHRDSDTVLPAIANRWQQGDQIPVLYLPDRDYDSVIVAVE
ncbi:MAG: serine/threonine-protein kinase [Gemmatimonadaceae bacterium]